jgi:hypothetical protein
MQTMERELDVQLDGMHMVLRRAALSLIHDVKSLGDGDRQGARQVAESANVLGGIVLVHGDAADAAEAVPAYVAAGRRAVLESRQHTIAALSALATGLSCVPWAGAHAEAVRSAIAFGRRLDDHLSAREELAMPVRERVLLAAC